MRLPIPNGCDTPLNDYLSGSKERRRKDGRHCIPCALPRPSGMTLQTPFDDRRKVRVPRSAHRFLRLNSSIRSETKSLRLFLVMAQLARMKNSAYENQSSNPRRFGMRMDLHAVPISIWCLRPGTTGRDGFV